MRKSECINMVPGELNIFNFFSSYQIALGTITNVDEAVEWLSYTYLYIRMRVNPLAYGIPYGTKEVCFSDNELCKQLL